MTPTLVIRRLDAGDVDAMVELTASAYAPRAPHQTREMLTLDVAADAGTACNLGAVDASSGRLVGMARAQRIADPWHVLDVCTDPALRRHGLAARLLGELLDELRPTDGGGVTLEVRVSNAAAIALYERFGFRASGTRARYYDDDQEDALVMWRPPAEVVDAGGADTWEPSL